MWVRLCVGGCVDVGEIAKCIIVIVRFFLRQDEIVGLRVRLMRRFWGVQQCGYGHGHIAYTHISKTNNDTESWGVRDMQNLTDIRRTGRRMGVMTIYY